MEEHPKGKEFKPSWPYFLFFGGLTIASFYSGVWWGGIMFGTGALLCFPNEKAHLWIMQQVINIKNLLVSFLYLGLVLLVIGGIIWFVGKTFGAIGNFGNYEGQTAKEWFNDYDEEIAQNEELNNKLNDYKDALSKANDNIETANSRIRSARNYAWESYQEMGDALDGLYTVDTIQEP